MSSKYKGEPATAETVNWDAEGKGQARQEVSYDGGGCRDCFWAVLFILQLGGLGAVLGLTYTSDTFNFSNSDAVKESFSSQDESYIFESIGVAMVVSICFAVLYMTMVRFFPTMCVYISLFFSAILVGAIGGYAAYIGEYMVAAIFGIFFALQLCWIWCVQSRIALAAVMLATASEVANHFWGTIVCTLLTIMLGTSVLLFWFVALYSCFKSMGLFDTNGTNQMPDSAYGVALAFIFSGVWIAQVKHAVVHCTAAGTFGTWYFQVTEQDQSTGEVNASCPSYQRAMTTSFGSLCYGSMIIAVIATLRAIAQNLEESDSCPARMIGCCLDCLLTCVQDIVQYIDSYAYTICGIYGKGYCEAVGEVMTLFAGNGFTMIINDDICDTVLSLGSLAGGCLAAGSALGFLYVQEASTTDYIGGGVGAFIIGLSIIGVVNASLSSGVKSFYVCFAKDPLVLFHTKPTHYNLIVGAWYGRWGGAGLPNQAFMEKVQAPMPGYDLSAAPPDYGSNTQSQPLIEGSGTKAYDTTQPV